MRVHSLHYSLSSRDAHKVRLKKALPISRIDTLRDAVRSGTYVVNLEAVAERLLQRARDAIL